MSVALCYLACSTAGVLLDLGAHIGSLAVFAKHMGAAEAARSFQEQSRLGLRLVFDEHVGVRSGMRRMLVKD